LHEGVWAGLGFADGTRSAAVEVHMRSDEVNWDMGPAMRHRVTAPVHLDRRSDCQALAETEFLKNGVQPAVARLGCGRVGRPLAGDGLLKIRPAPFQAMPTAI
jgi:hypothetical protein